jgi:hypothetical protein
LAHAIFVSKRNTLDKLQCKFCTKLNQIFRNRELKLRKLGTEGYSNNNKAPSLAVLQLISKCDGLIALGLRQILVECGSRSTSIRRAIEGYLQVKVKRGAGKK